jgi:two-component system LytT family sensor kinase
LLNLYLLRRHRADCLLHPMIALCTTLFAESIQMLIILAMARPFDQAARLVAHIVLPMVLSNALGASLFMRLILDRRAHARKIFHRLFGQGATYRRAFRWRADAGIQ